jgi:DNA-binding MarR family transcriptional regulator
MADLPNPTPAPVTDVIFETFRLHGRLIAFGDEMVREYGLTSARWQILGSIALASGDMTVPHIARNLGLSRQAVQRVTNDLAQDGFVAYEDNPHHKRAKRVSLTRKGRHIYDTADCKYTAWMDSVAGEFRPDAMRATLETMRRLEDCCNTYLDQIEREKQT